MSVFIPISKKGNAKECSNYHTIALISHSSKVMLKIPQPGSTVCEPWTSSLNIWKFTIHVLLKPGLEIFEHYFTSVWDECSCAVVWSFFGIAFLWDWYENWRFPVLWPLLSFPNFAWICCSCLVLTVASWPEYRFLRRQITWSGIFTTLKIFQFVVIHTTKGFGIVNETEIDFLGGTPLLSLWSNRCWQFDFCFPCFF